MKATIHIPTYGSFFALSALIAAELPVRGPGLVVFNLTGYTIDLPQGCRIGTVLVFGGCAVHEEVRWPISRPSRAWPSQAECLRVWELLSISVRSHLYWH